MKVDKIAEVDVDTCIGCGVCVTHCPMEALALVRRPEDKQVEMPDEVKQHVG
jgi:NAD-dependent dihydropyrimidine dehydrogenase PreA subunit